MWPPPPKNLQPCPVWIGSSSAASCWWETVGNLLICVFLNVQVLPQRGLFLPCSTLILLSSLDQRYMSGFHGDLQPRLMGNVVLSVASSCFAAAGSSCGLAGLPDVLPGSSGPERHRACRSVRQRVPAAGVRAHQQDGPQVSAAGPGRARPSDPDHTLPLHNTEQLLIHRQNMYKTFKFTVFFSCCIHLPQKQLCTFKF